MFKVLGKKIKYILKKREWTKIKKILLNLFLYKTMLKVSNLKGRMP